MATTATKPIPLDAPTRSVYGPALLITSQEDADRYFAALVARRMLAGESSRGKAEEIERHNLTFWASQADAVVRERVERLFGVDFQKGPQCQSLKHR